MSTALVIGDLVILSGCTGDLGLVIKSANYDESQYSPDSLWLIYSVWDREVVYLYADEVEIMQKRG